MQFFRTGFLGCTRFRVADESNHQITTLIANICCCSPQGGWLMFIQPDMSGMSFLCKLRAPVKSFPMYVAFPRSEYYA